jgi:predicted phosphodiesterase
MPKKSPQKNNPFNLPESFEEPFEHYIVPPQYKNWLIMSDMHFPYHNIRAITESLNYGIAKNIDAILINGDGLDCYQLSKFNPDPRKRNMAEELDAFGQFLDIIRNIAPVFWKFGNHCERLERLLIRNAPVLLGIEDFELESLLRCGERKIEVIKDQRIVYIGKLPIVHGHELRLMGVAVNAARSLFLKTKKSALCSHLHQTSSHNESTIDDRLISTWSIGHLGDPHPEYARINKWNHGVGRIEVDGEGNFEVVNLRLINNRLYRS